MGSATVNGTIMTRQLGYLSKETAQQLKGEKEIDARPYSVYLPYNKSRYGLRIRVLIRSASYKKMMKNKFDLDCYVAINIQGLKDIMRITDELKSSDYYLFIDFYRNNRDILSKICNNKKEGI